MRVLNKTPAVINYGGFAYGPNKSFEIAAEDEEKRDIVALLGDGRLVPVMADEAPAAKPSKGLNVEQIKQALVAKGVTDFDANAKKDDLAALLDAQ